MKDVRSVEFAIKADWRFFLFKQLKAGLLFFQQRKVLLD